jgi:N-terminal domain of BNR-repeat neuraminidase/Secretion system C-terminal sorting domain
MKLMKRTGSLIRNLFFLPILLYVSMCSLQAQQVSVTTLQSNVTCAYPGDSNVPVIVVKVTANAIPLSAYALFLSTTGSTNPLTDISSAKVFYTGSSNTFSAATQYGSAIPNPNGFITINSGIPFTLTQGDNFFWIAFDISPTAIINDTLDATCTSVYLSNGTYTPTVIDPAGEIIIGCTTGLETVYNASTINMYPNPTVDYLFIEASTGYFKIYDRIGNCLYQQVVNNSFTLDMKNFSPGVYVAELILHNKTIVNKIVKQ